MKHLFTQPIIVFLAICIASVAENPAATASPAAAQAPSLKALAGSWKVSAVRVDEADVQALVKNDPSYMGAVLKITPERLSWQPHKGGELSDVCDKPRLARDGEISCGSGAFGPPGTKLAVDRKTLKLDWYDGGTLVLSRIR